MPCVNHQFHVKYYPIQTTVFINFGTNPQQAKYQYDVQVTQKSKSLLSKERLKKQVCKTQKACNSVSFFYIWRSLCRPVQTTILPWGCRWLAGLQLNRPAVKLISLGGIKQADHRLTLTMYATGLKSRRLHGQTTDVEFRRFFHPLSLGQIPALLVFEVYLTIRQTRCFEDTKISAPRCFEDTKIFAPIWTLSLGSKRER
jgi:hypothetical protein